MFMFRTVGVCTRVHYSVCIEVEKKERKKERKDRSDLSARVSVAGKTLR